MGEFLKKPTIKMNESMKMQYLKDTEFFDKAFEDAESGDLFVQYQLANLYLAHNDSENYLYWLEMAAKNGSPAGQLDLALTYNFGSGGPVNHTRAVYWYEQLITSGEGPEELRSQALHNLAICYDNGTGVPRNHAKAEEFFRAAAALGNEGSKEALANRPKSGGCYIATCVYGSYESPEVWTLRHFRDNTLETSWLGRQFVRMYYTISPKIVNKFGNKRWFNVFCKAILYRIVSKLQQESDKSHQHTDI